MGVSRGTVAAATGVVDEGRQGQTEQHRVAGNRRDPVPDVDRDRGPPQLGEQVLDHDGFPLDFAATEGQERTRGGEARRRGTATAGRTPPGTKGGVPGFRRISPCRSRSSSRKLTTCWRPRTDAVPERAICRVFSALRTVSRARASSSERGQAAGDHGQVGQRLGPRGRVVRGQVDHRHPLHPERRSHRHRDHGSEGRVRSFQRVSEVEAVRGLVQARLGARPGTGPPRCALPEGSRSRGSRSGPSSAATRKERSGSITRNEPWDAPAASAIRHHARSRSTGSRGWPARTSWAAARA